MRVVVLDLETIPDPALPFEPPADRPTAFAPPPHHQIVAFGALCWGNQGPVRLSCLGAADGFSEAAALREFSQLLVPGTQIVTWNGNRFDMPVIVARSLKHRVPLRSYFTCRGYRYRFTEDGHLDLKDQLSDYAMRDAAGLDVWAKLIGLEGKGDTDGTMVADLWRAGEHERVRRYCLHDVVTTTRLWLEWRHLTGRVTSDELAAEYLKLNEFIEGQTRVEAA